jgi:predicted metal-binding protein
MAQNQRKTLVVCTTCHDDIHAGKPYRRYTEKTGPGQ